MTLLKVSHKFMIHHFTFNEIKLNVALFTQIYLDLHNFCQRY